MRHDTDMEALNKFKNFKHVDYIEIWKPDSVNMFEDVLAAIWLSPSDFSLEYLPLTLDRIYLIIVQLG